ncbi:hypothetical protein GCM10009555_051480 [Acrocarpospora macrocephala]|uniref:FAD-binding FR-type domain-containing protein n=1 Tax=Acrocarpospora macrocephala TaxID=150177 RepID=A0A5M3XDM2_9ACTN|nr:siderophore-interacting protein [Acrocarpospora macrocephala]GES16993.1 hypothetical protein Amac_105910 [Acrocarpospora macrocephala]
MSRSLGRRVRDLILVTGLVTEVRMVAGRMLGIRVEGEGIGDLAWVAGQQVRVLVTDPLTFQNWRRPRDFLRTYSVWNLDGGLELRVLDHGDGPGARWARGLKVGDEVTFNKPEGAFVAQKAAFHLFVGEETAAVAFGPMIRGLDSSASVYGVVEVAGPEDRLELGDRIQWIFRGERSAAESDALVEAVRELSLPGDGDGDGDGSGSGGGDGSDGHGHGGGGHGDGDGHGGGDGRGYGSDDGHGGYDGGGGEGKSKGSGGGVAYVAGEAKTVQRVREHLVRERGWSRRAVLTKPFWTPGKIGME